MTQGRWGGTDLHGAFALAVLLLAAGFLLLAGEAAAQQSEADVFVAQAILAYEDKRYEEALGFLREALALDPANVDALYYIGLVLMAQRKPAEAAPVLERARETAPSDFAIGHQLGVAYFSLERYDKAEPLLTQVFREQPRTDSVGYYVGFMRYRNKDYQGALQAFRSGTTSDPNIQQLTRFYAGLALANLGLPEQAAAEVDAALRAQPASPLTGPAERLRDAIVASREQERRFRAEVRVGFFYDDNVAVVPDPSRDPDAESVRGQKTKSTGELAALRLEYSWLRTGPWDATIGYSFFQTYNNSLPSFNIQSHLGFLGISYRGVVKAMPFQVGAQYSYDHLLLDEESFVQRHTVSLFGTLVESAAHLTVVQTRFQAKGFFEDISGLIPEEGRDAQNWLAGFLHILRFAGDKHFLRFGYQFDVEDADGRNVEYVGSRLLAGAQYTLPWGGTRLRYDYDVHFRNYLHAHTLLPSNNPGTRERADTEQTHVFKVEQPLPHSLTLSAEYQRTVSRSNLPIFSFTRNFFALILSWQR